MRTMVALLVLLVCACAYAGDVDTVAEKKVTLTQEQLDKIINAAVEKAVAKAKVEIKAEYDRRDAAAKAERQKRESEEQELQRLRDARAKRMAERLGRAKGRMAAHEARIKEIVKRSLQGNKK